MVGRCCGSDVVGAGPLERLAHPGGGSGGEGAGEDLPGEGGFGGEAEEDVGAFAVEVAAPGADAGVLEGHVEGEAVEEEEEGDVDGEDEGGWGGFGAGADEIDADGDPGDEAGEAAEPEGEPVGFAGSLVVLHEEAEEDHGGVDAEEGDEGGDIADAAEHGDEDDHEGGGEGVFDPAGVVAAFVEGAQVPGVDSGGGDQEVCGGGDEEEGGDAVGEVEVEPGGELRFVNAWRALEEGGGDGECEVVGEDEDGCGLGGVKRGHDEIKGAQVVRVHR